MSILELIFILLAGGLASIALIIIYHMFTNAIAYMKFKRSLKGIPIASGFSLFDCHAGSHLFMEHLIHNIGKIIQDSGSKTLAFLLRSQPVVVTHDLDLIKRVLTDEKAINRMRICLPIKEAGKDSFMLTRNEQWQRIRRAFAPALRPNKFKTPNVQAEIDSSIQKLIDSIENKLSICLGQNDLSTKPVDFNMDELIIRFNLDLLLSCLFKQSHLIDFNLAEPDPMAKNMNEGLESMGSNPIARWSMSYPLIAPLVDWFSLHFMAKGSWRKSINKFIKQQTQLNLEARSQIAASRAAGEHVNEDNFQLKDGTKFSRNMIDYVIDQFHEGKLTKTEYFHSTFILLNGGYRTTADSLVHTIYQLATNDKIQTKLRESLLSDGIHSQYLTWVLNESLRILPPVPAACTRLIERTLELDDGCVIPANTCMITPAYSIHRLKQYWGPDVEEFRPERFADSDSFHPFQFIPFGAGPRICVAKEFALHQMKKVICALITRYKFQCEPMQNHYNTILLLFLIPDNETIIRISRLE